MLIQIQYLKIKTWYKAPVRRTPSISYMLSPTSRLHRSIGPLFPYESFKDLRDALKQGGQYIYIFFTRATNDIVSWFADRTCKITISGILNPPNYCVIFILYVSIMCIIYKCSCDPVTKNVGPPPAREMDTSVLKHLPVPMELNG